MNAYILYIILAANPSSPPEENTRRDTTHTVARSIPNHAETALSESSAPTAEDATEGKGTQKPDTPDATSHFDLERQMWMHDTDRDGFPDLTEELGGTSILDPQKNPGVIEAESAGFPTTSCRSGFRQAGYRLCISTSTQNAATYTDAVARCRDKLSHVCTHEDLMYLYLRSSLDATYNPYGAWIGNQAQDDTILCGNCSITYDNDPDIYNFEGPCAKWDSRHYWCCHDDEG